MPNQTTDEKYKRLTGLWDKFHERTDAIIVLSDFQVDIRLGNDEQTKGDDACYCRSLHTVFVNERLFGRDPEIQLALFAHEIAHAYIHIKAVPIPSCKPGRGVMVEDMWADRLACEWGFLDGLRNDRMGHRDYGADYVKCLEKFRDLGDFTDCMCRWKLQRNMDTLSRL